MTSPHGFKRNYSRRLLSTFVTLGLLAACSDDDSFPVIPDFDAGADAGGFSSDPTDTESDTTDGTGSTTDDTATDQTSTDDTATDSTSTDDTATDQTSTDDTATDQTSTDDTATDQTSTDDTATDDSSGPDASTGDQSSTSDQTLSTDETLGSDETSSSAPTGVIIGDSGVTDETTDPTSTDGTTDLTIIDVTFGDAGADAAPDAAAESDETDSTESSTENTTDVMVDASAGEMTDAGADAASTDMPPDSDAGANITLTTLDYAGSTMGLMPDEIEDAYLHATLEGAIDALLLAQTDAGGAIIGEQFWWSKPGQPIPESVDIIGGDTTFWNVYVLEEETPVMSNGTMTALPSGTHHLDVYASWVPFTETAYFRLFAFDSLGNVIDTQDFVY